MSYTLKFSIGDAVTNSTIRETFGCSLQGGMRKSNKTNSLVLVCDHTKVLYEDKWKGDVLHYTGMGQNGDMSLDFMQNKTLAQSNSNGVEVHLFEVLERSQYIYRGQVYLCDEPYQETQPDENGTIRRVWIFPLKLKDVKKLFDENIDRD